MVRRQQMRTARPVSRIAFLVVAALVFAGCSAVRDATQRSEVGGETECPSDRLVNGTRVLSCREAVQAAEQALGWLHWPVSSANFTRGAGSCPKKRDGGDGPAQLGLAAPPLPPPVLTPRCSRIGRDLQGTVAFTFWFGEPLPVYVALDENEVAVAYVPGVDEFVQPGLPAIRDGD
jgi:hypothetical protein